MRESERMDFVAQCMLPAIHAVEVMSRQALAVTDAKFAKLRHSLVLTFGQLRRYNFERHHPEIVMARMGKRWYEIILIETDGERTFPLGRYYTETETVAVERAKKKFRGTLAKLELTCWQYQALPVDGEKPRRVAEAKVATVPLFDAVLAEESK